MAFSLDNVKGLLKNKYALAGLVGAAGIGGYVLLKRKSSTGSSLSADQATSATSPTGQTYGGINTTGTDIATWLGNQSGQFQNQFDAFAAQQADFLSKLGAGSNPTSPTGQNNPFPGTPKPTKTVTTKAKAGDTWQSIVNRYFAHSGTPTTNAAALQAWDKLHGGTGNITAGGNIHLPNGSPGFA